MKSAQPSGWREGLGLWAALLGIAGTVGAVVVLNTRVGFGTSRVAIVNTAATLWLGGSLTGLVLSSVAGRFGSVLVNLALIAVPGLTLVGGPPLLGASNNEASAIGSLRAIDSAQADYAAACAKGAYATDLAELAKAPPGGMPFISPDLASNGIVKAGYIITLKRDAAAEVTEFEADTCNGTKVRLASSYVATATPVEFRSSGWRYFATDARGTIFESEKGPIPIPIRLGPDVQPAH